MSYWGCPLEGDTQLRHSLPFAAFRLYFHFFLLHDEPRLVKRRRALRERNPPRNSQLETHRTDESWGNPTRIAPAFFPANSSGDRFPHASENSYRRLQNLRNLRRRSCSRAGDRYQCSLEFRRREIAQGRMQPLMVVQMFQKKR